jgi:hypothetical protein
MASVQGIREKVHLPIYDSLSVESGKQLRDAESTSTLKFFVDVQKKTKLETNLQSASLLPHYNTFEARAMRVVISDLPPEFPEKSETLKLTDDGYDVTDDADPPAQIFVDGNGKVVASTATGAQPVTADLELGLDRVMELLREARESEDKTATIDVDEKGKGVTLRAGTTTVDVDVDSVLDAGGSIEISRGEIEALISDLDTKFQPPDEQLRPNDGAGTIIGKLIYNTVTTLYVGEKIMIQMPTWFFPGGAGPYSEAAKFTTHGEPSPTATFRFAEPIFIDKQQNFRVEIEVPDTDTLKQIQRIYGPMNIWVVLDGYMTRDVQ